MKRKQLYLPKDIDERLKDAALSRNVSEAFLVREALAQYLPENKSSASKKDDPIQGIIGICKDGPRDGAKNHDYYLYGKEKE